MFLRSQQQISISRLTFQPRALSTLSACSLTRSKSLRASSEFGIFFISSTFQTVLSSRVPRLAIVYGRGLYGEMSRA